MKSRPNPDEIYIPDPGYNVIIYNGECYSRTDGRGTIDTLPGYPDEGYNTCIDCLAVNPTPTPTPTLTYPAPALVGFPMEIKGYMEGLSAIIEVHRQDGIGQPFNVDYEISPMDARQDADFYAPDGYNGTLKFAPNDMIQRIALNLNLDYELNENPELLQIILKNPESTVSRSSAELSDTYPVHIVQIIESGLPPATTVSAGDIFEVDGSLLNVRFIGDTGESATINLYPDRVQYPLDYYAITIGNDGGVFVWDKDSMLSNSHKFELTPPEDHDFTFHFVPAGVDLTYTITYLGPGSFFFNIIAPPLPTPTLAEPI